MDRRGDTILTFAKCFRLLAKIGAGLEDGFFSVLINRKSEELLVYYVKFLETQGETLAKNNQYSNYVAWHTKHVAQCGQIIYKIKDIIQLLDILKYLDLAKTATPLLLEKNLLYLESLIFDYKKQPTTTGLDTKAGHQSSPETIVKKLPQNLGKTHNEIAGFIGSKERAQNIEVFAKFANIARRTLKRKLSELIKAGIIKRITTGKHVFYLSISSSSKLSETSEGQP